MSESELADRLACAESELAELRRQIDHYQRLATLGTVAAGVAHEINNILTPVLAYAQLAQKRPDDRDAVAKAIERAAAGADSATQIVQHMLGFATGSDTDAPCRIDEALNEALACIGRQPEKDHIRISRDIRGGGVVQMRQLALQQVFINLLLNAWAALRGKGGVIAISSVERSDGTTVIHVSDTGPGIPKEIAGRLFEPFVTSRADTGAMSFASPKSRSGGGGSAKPGGSGLGLSICRQAVESAGGSICAASLPAKGTTFTITLPTGQITRAKAS